MGYVLALQQLTGNISAGETNTPAPLPVTCRALKGARGGEEEEEVGLRALSGEGPYAGLGE